MSSSNQSSTHRTPNNNGGKTVLDKITTAIKFLNAPKTCCYSSHAAIMKYLKSELHYENTSAIEIALKKGVNKKILIQKGQSFAIQAEFVEEARKRKEERQRYLSHPLRKRLREFLKHNDWYSVKESYSPSNEVQQFAKYFAEDMGSDGSYGPPSINKMIIEADDTHDDPLEVLIIGTHTGGEHSGDGYVTVFFNAKDDMNLHESYEY